MAKGGLLVQESQPLGMQLQRGLGSISAHDNNNNISATALTNMLEHSWKLRLYKTDIWSPWFVDLCA